MSSILRRPSSTDLIGVFSLWSDKSFPVYPAHERALLDSGDPKRLRPGASTVRDTFGADVPFLALHLIAAAAALDLESSPAAGVNEPDRSEERRVGKECGGQGGVDHVRYG